jgi:hypothetical protein
LDFKSSIQRELDKFFKALDETDFNIRKVTKGAFSKARKLLDPYAFSRLNEVAVNTFYEEAPYYNWLGHRLLACDGSRIVLPKHETTIRDFGQHNFGPNSDSPKTLALISMLYDPLNLISIDAQIDRYASSERSLLVKHLQKTRPGDLLLLDRGYACFWLFFLLSAMGVEFCVRMKEDWWIEANEFLKSGENERIVEFALPTKDHDKLSDYKDIIYKKIRCRLVKVILENGETEILCTSLLDPVKYKIEGFEMLYHIRWNEEEAYKLLKCRAELENFSGKTSIAVRQDFQAKIFSMTLCAIYAHPIEEKVREEFKADENRKYDQKINRTSALSMLQSLFVPIFLKKKYKKAIEAFDDIVYKTREIIRPNRKYPRNHKPKKLYNMVYKRL